MSDEGASEADCHQLLEIRAKNRIDIQDIRDRNKNDIFKKKRVRYEDIEGSFKPMTVDEFGELTLSLKKSKPTVELLEKITKGLYGGVEYIERFFRVDGAFKIIVNTLSGNNAEKQFIAAAILTNLACGSHKSCLKIAKAAGPYLIWHIEGGGHFLKDQCLMVISNVICDCKICFGILKSQGVLPVLLEALQHDLPAVVESACSTLASCTKYEDDEIVIDLVKDTLLKCMLVIMQQYDSQSLTFVEASAALVHCCYITCSHSPSSFDEKTVEIIMTYLARALTNLTSEISAATSLLISLGYISCRGVLGLHIVRHETFRFIVQELMSSSFHHLKKNILWVVNNILELPKCEFDPTLLLPIIERIGIFLNPLDPSMPQALYFLCMSINLQELSGLLDKNALIPQLECLQSYNNEHLDKVYKYLLSVLRT